MCLDMLLAFSLLKMAARWPAGWLYSTRLGTHGAHGWAIQIEYKYAEGNPSIYLIYEWVYHYAMDPRPTRH